MMALAGKQQQQQEGEWVDNQEKAFTRWVNEKLRPRGIVVGDLCADISDGTALVALLEELSGKRPLPGAEATTQRPRLRLQKLENCGAALRFLEREGVRTVNIGPADVVDGNRKLVLGLIWTLILRYQIAQQPLSSSSSSSQQQQQPSQQQAKGELLEWVRSKVVPEGYDVRGFGHRDWGDGRAICGLVHALDASLCADHRGLSPSDARRNAARGVGAATDALGVPVIVLPEEMVSPACDELGMATYLSVIRDMERRGLFGRKQQQQRQQQPPEDVAARCRLRTTPVGECEVGQRCEFDVDGVPGGRLLEVFLEGPATTAKPDVHRGSDGSYHVVFTPTEPGEWKVHVNVDRRPVKGSPFAVVVKPKKKVATTTTTTTVIYRRGTHCGRCGNKLDPAARYCGVCGEPAYDAKRRCPNKRCREFIDDLCRVCPKCGAPCPLVK